MAETSSTTVSNYGKVELTGEEWKMLAPKMAMLPDYENRTIELQDKDGKQIGTFSQEDGQKSGGTLEYDKTNEHFAKAVQALKLEERIPVMASTQEAPAQTLAEERPVATQAPQAQAEERTVAPQALAEERSVPSQASQTTEASAKPENVNARQEVKQATSEPQNQTKQDQSKPVSFKNNDSGKDGLSDAAIGEAVKRSMRRAKATGVGALAGIAQEMAFGNNPYDEKGGKAGAMFGTAIAAIGMGMVAMLAIAIPPLGAAIVAHAALAGVAAAVGLGSSAVIGGLAGGHKQAAGKALLGAMAGNVMARATEGKENKQENQQSQSREAGVQTTSQAAAKANDATAAKDEPKAADKDYVALTAKMEKMEQELRQLNTIVAENTALKAQLEELRNGRATPEAQTYRQAQPIERAEPVAEIAPNTQAQGASQRPVATSEGDKNVVDALKGVMKELEKAEPGSINNGDKALQLMQDVLDNKVGNDRFKSMSTSDRIIETLESLDKGALGASSQRQTMVKQIVSAVISGNVDVASSKAQDMRELAAMSQQLGRSVSVNDILSGPVDTSRNESNIGHLVSGGSDAQNVGSVATSGAGKQVNREAARV